MAYGLHFETALAPGIDATPQRHDIGELEFS
jgi:hypothetical protein